MFQPFFPGPAPAPIWSQGGWSSFWPKLHQGWVYHTTALGWRLDNAQDPSALGGSVPWQLQWWRRRWSIQVETAKRWWRRPSQGCDWPTPRCGWWWRENVERVSSWIAGYSWSRRRRNRRRRLQQGGLVVSSPLSAPGPCSCTAVTATPSRSWWQGCWRWSSCRRGWWRLKQKLDWWDAFPWRNCQCGTLTGLLQFFKYLEDLHELGFHF